MPELAATVITDALVELLIQPREQPVETEMMQAGIRQLNRMMSQFEVLGINLGYIPIVNPANVVTVSDRAIEGVVKNLALKLAPSYGVPVSIDLSREAKLGRLALHKISPKLNEKSFPSTMPLGSGNRYHEFDETFFRERDPTTSALLVAENSTVNTLDLATPTLVSNLWKVENHVNFNANLDGRLTYRGRDKRTVTFELAASIDPVSGVNIVSNIYLAKNGAVLTSSKVEIIATAGTPNSGFVTFNVDAKGNDYFEMFIESVDGTNLSLVSASIRAYE